MSSKLYFLSLGCDKNLSDSEHMLSLLLENGYEMVEDEQDADVAVLNSCAFISDAKKESIGEILHLADLKKNGKLKRIVVTGCLSERYKEEIRKEIPEVDFLLGTSSWDRITELLNAEPGQAIFDSPTRLPLSDSRTLTGPGYYGYLKISEGCSKHCAYCIIPSLRGPYRSIPMETLVEEAKNLASQGVKELILVAQETTLYGVDLYHQKKLPTLLRKLSRVAGIRWIRLCYCYPEEITEELIAVLKTNKKIVPYLDIPIQHASDKILKSMQRSTTRKEITKRIKDLREAIPNLAIRTTFMTGFPGETDEDFRELLSFVKRMKLDHVGVFTYSREEGTKAYSMKPQIKESVKKARRKELMEVQQKISLSLQKKKIGTVLTCILEGRVTGEDSVYLCRTPFDAPDVDSNVFVYSEKEHMTGDFLKVRITQASCYDLMGEEV